MARSRSYLSPLDPNPDHPTPIQLLRQADYLRRNVEERLEKWDLTWGQYDLLMYIHDTDERIGARTHQRKLGSGLPRRLDKLEQKGYVEKKGLPSDGRKKMVVLTDDGRRKLGEATEALKDVDTGAIGS